MKDQEIELAEGFRGRVLVLVRVNGSPRGRNSRSTRTTRTNTKPWFVC